MLEQALAHNRDLRIATARVAEARASYRIQGAALYPDLSASAAYSLASDKSQFPFDLGGSGGGGDVRIERLSAQLSTGWEIDFWGRVANLRDAALERYLATEEGRRAVATQLIAQVANGYLLELEYAERIALADGTIATRRDALRIARRRHELGAASKLDRTQAEVLLGQAETALHVLRMERAVNRNALELLVGRPVAIEAGAGHLRTLALDGALPPGLPSELLIHRPDIVAAEHGLRAANADIGAARAAFFPNIRLTGATGYSSMEVDGLIDRTGGFVWSFQPQITLPIFDAGQRAGALQAAKARRDAAVAEYEQAIQRAFRDVADAMVRRRELAAQIAPMRTTLAALRERTRLAQLRYDSGKSGYLEVLDAERDRFATEQQLAQLDRAYLAAGVALYAALGGGFAETTPERASDEEEGAR